MARKWETPDIERALGLVAWLMGLGESLAWYGGFVLDGWKCVRRRGEWTLVIQAHEGTGPGGTLHLVTFVNGASPYECINAFASEVRRGNIKWHEDRYPPNVGD